MIGEMRRIFSSFFFYGKIVVVEQVHFWISIANNFTFRMENLQYEMVSIFDQTNS